MPRLQACLLYTSFFRKRSNRSQENVTDRFWKRESIANNTRLQDLSGLPYITIPFDKFPIGMYENDLLKNYENTLQTLAGQKIVNFGTQTNTDLKITYGTASLPALTEYEQNFTTLCQTLTAYAGQLFELGHTDDARTILELSLIHISSKLISAAQIQRNYGYQILDGRRSPSRDKVISLCLAPVSYTHLKLQKETGRYREMDRDRCGGGYYYCSNVGRWSG